MVYIVYLRDFQEVVHHQALGTAERHHAAWATWHEFRLRSVTTVQLEIYFVVEVALDMFNVLQVTEAQVINLVGKIKGMSSHD